MTNIKNIPRAASILLSLFSLFSTATPSSAALSTNEQNLKGIWFNEATNGQGVVADVLEGDSGNTVFMSWYTYTANGQDKLWLVFQKPSALQQSASQSIDLYIAEDRGHDNSLPRFNQRPTVEVQKVGAATIQLLSATNLRIAFTFDPAFQADSRWGVSGGEMDLTKIIGTNTALTQSEQGLIGTWFNPETAGQGLQTSVIRGGNTHTLFASWYTYANTGEKLWLILQGPTAPNADSHVVDLYIVTTNGVFNAPPRRSVERIGTATVQLMSPTNLRLTFGFEAGLQNDLRWAGSPSTMDLTRIGGGPTVAASHLINTLDRNAVLNAYRTRFMAPVPPMNWTGSIANCVAGTTSPAFQQRVVDQINYFRGMAGVIPSAVMSTIDYSNAQEAALMMAANGTLTHSPPPSWRCFTTGGANSAARSLLAAVSGLPGPAAIAGYIEDVGPQNTAVGHRRWVLYPQVMSFTTADVITPNNLGYNTLGFTLSSSEGSTVREYVAWPSPGYFPGVHLPTARRWSLTVRGADFRQSQVAVRNENTNQVIVANPEPVVGGYGDNTFVWMMSNFNPAAISEDTSVQITVSNVVVGGGYEVVSVQCDVYSCELESKMGVAYSGRSPRITSPHVSAARLSSQPWPVCRARGHGRVDVPGSRDVEEERAGPV